MIGKKHRPQRTCIACRQVFDKQDLIRLVRTSTGKVDVDPTGKANGRGAYVCLKSSCWQKGLKKKLLENALKTMLSVSDVEMLEIYLQTELSKNIIH